MQAEHKWRMKNDLDYKNQVARQKAQGSQANHHVTDSKNNTKPIKGGSLGGGSIGIGEFIEQIK